MLFDTLFSAICQTPIRYNSHAACANLPKQAVPSKWVARLYLGSPLLVGFGWFRGETTRKTRVFFGGLENDTPKIKGRQIFAWNLKQSFTNGGFPHCHLPMVAGNVVQRCGYVMPQNLYLFDLWLGRYPRTSRQ